MKMVRPIACGPLVDFCDKFTSVIVNVNINGFVRPAHTHLASKESLESCLVNASAEQL